MGKQRRELSLRERAASLRGIMHAIVLAAIALVVGVTSLTASAAEADPAARGPEHDPPATTVEAAVQTPADVQLRVGDSASLDGGALVVTLLAITEDSRCPKDVMCVWQGRAVVALHVELDGSDRGEVSATLMPGGRGAQASKLDASVGRYTLALTDLQPYPDSSHPEPTLGSVATLHVATTP